MSKKLIEIDLRQAGQPRAYADSVYEAYISCRDDGTLLHGAQFYVSLEESQVHALTRLFVHAFAETPVQAFAPRLDTCRPIGPSPEMRAIAHGRWEPTAESRWHVKVICPFTD